MDKSIILIFFLTCLSCTNHKNDKPADTNSMSGRDSAENKYFEIIKGLKYEYVLYYRQLKAGNTDLKLFGLPTDDSIYRIDSAKYFESFERFFQQDHHFIDWLLKFKNDSTKSGLWQKYLSPQSSYIGECCLPMSNSRAAINLVENFLNGEGFECHECTYQDLHCNVKKYEEVESFIEFNKGKDIPALRKEWKKKYPY